MKKKSKKKSKFELPKDHLATVASDGSRIALYPEIIEGVWRRRRTVFQSILVIFFLILPWLRFNGDQLIFLDVLGKKLTLFGSTFWAHDSPTLFLIAMTLVLLLAVATAWWGRVWCGWGCPQTVFIEGVFRRIEVFIEGNHLKRRTLNEGPLNSNFFLKKGTKWFLYGFVSLILTHSFLAYFVGSDQLLLMIQGGPRENWIAFIVILITTAIVLFDFGIFREQFCVLVCPYGRLQSVLLDKQSLAVSYDFKRGEPRKGTQGVTGETQTDETQGDCVNCYKCVSVCPTGVDIRRGQQLECIHCTACMDACDSIMDKVGSDRGLIRYMSESETEGKERKFLRTRPIVYLAMLCVCLGILIYSLVNRNVIHATFVRATEAPYTTIPNEPGRVTNHFKLNIKNQSSKRQTVFVSIPTEQKREPEGGQQGQGQGQEREIDLIFPGNPLTLKPGETKRSHFFLKFNQNLTSSEGFFRTKIQLKDSFGDTQNYEFSILGPKSN